MKGKDQVIQEFNELVNMSASELEKWLKSDDSNSAGWPKEDENGETVGHDSGRKIVEILKENPEKEAEKYTDEQVEHMRKVVSYCKRHLAQETKSNSEKSAEEVKKTKSYASLKNWGHDFLKARGKQDDEKEEDGDKQAGDKRKTTQNQSGPNKKRETAKGESETKDEEEEEEISEEDADEPKESKTSNGNSKNEKASNDKDESTPMKGPKKGETVSWKWGQGEPEGKVLDVKAEEIEPSIRVRRAIHANDATLLRRILKTHPSLLLNPDSSPSGLSNSNMHLAAQLGNREICEVLLELGHEDPCPALNESHQTALMLAAAAGHTEVVHLLCEHDKTCILRRDIRGRDAVMEASLGGHDTIVQLLLTYVPGGPYDAVRRSDVEGNTALHFASGNGNLLVLRTLLAAGADMHKRNIWNWTPAAYSATVQAEVYLKGLVNEVGKRQQLKREIETAKKGAGLRVVDPTSDDE
ncbi:hypothetical protein LCI18_011478 [Fusarium solani-melongenae]|uniref:Uncharacterized protein n=1 Tax=Fusarium solani subsp. cucurbitae TaxID=2747967 RepID=A0ACD3ZHI5_FUSSC|nr:hypothetical protein LCI18_011478 [Fusarium solani-melongenae]